MRELKLVPERSMHFCRLGHARIAALFSRKATPFLWIGSAERFKLSLERACLPCGPGFPQTLLTCRRPVFPPDRAPLSSLLTPVRPVYSTWCPMLHLRFVLLLNTSDNR